MNKKIFVIFMVLVATFFLICGEEGDGYLYGTDGGSRDSSGGDVVAPGDIVAPNVYGSCTVGNSCTNDVREQNCDGVFEANQTCPMKTLTISREPSSAATVNFSVNGRTVEQISEYPIGSEINVCLDSHAGFVFDYWSGDNINDENKMNRCITLTMDDDKEVTAHFTPAYDPVVNRITHGDGVGGVISIDTTAGVNPQRLTFSNNTNRTNHLDNTPVRVCVDSVNHNYRFLGWSGTVNSQDVCVNVNMTNHRELTATFARQVTLNFTRIVDDIVTTPQTTEGGTIRIDNSTIAETSIFDAGTIIEVCASPTSAYRFDGWSGDLTGTTVCQTITMDDDKTVTVTFSRPRLSITRTPIEGGVVTVSQASGSVITYNLLSPNPAISRQPLNTTITICAQADENYVFSGWSGDSTTTGRCISNLRMDDDKSFTANFELE